MVTTSDNIRPTAEYAEQCATLRFGREALFDWSAGTGPAPWGGLITTAASVNARPRVPPRLPATYTGSSWAWVFGNRTARTAMSSSSLPPL